MRQRQEAEAERNAVIIDAGIFVEDHGFLTASLTLDYGGSGQGFGLYALYVPERPGFNAAGHFIWRVLEVVGVGDWKDLVGKTVKVRHDSSKVHAIANIIGNKWFEPSVEFDRLSAAFTLLYKGE